MTYFIYFIYFYYNPNYRNKKGGFRKDEKDGNTAGGGFAPACRKNNRHSFCLPDFILQSRFVFKNYSFTAFCPPGL